MESLEEIDVSELVEMLTQTESVEEQGDIVYCLWLKKCVHTCIFHKRSGLVSALGLRLELPFRSYRIAR